MGYEKCPFGKEWDTLVSQVGEDLADYIYVHYDNVPDSVDKATLIKRVGFKPTMSQVEYYKMIRKLSDVNNVKGHSHFPFISKRYTKNAKMMYDMDFKMNYLPLNVETNRRKASAVSDTHYIPSIDNLFDPSRTRKSDSDEDFIIPTAKKQIKNVESIRREKIYNQITELNAKSRMTKDPFTVRALLSQVETLQLQLDSAEIRIENTNKIETFDNIVVSADEQLSEIQEMLSKNDISPNNMLYAERILNLWRSAGDFSGNDTDHIILDQDEFNSPEIKQVFRSIGARAEDLQSRLNVVRDEHLVVFMKEHSNNKSITKEEIFADLKDTGKNRTLTLNLGRNADPILQMIFSATERAHVLARDEANDIFKNIDEATEKVLPKLRALGNVLSNNPWRFFEQTTENGLGTGDLTHRYSAEYFQKINTLRYNAFNKPDKDGKKGTNKAAIEAYYKWTEDNTMSFDVRKLFIDSVHEGEDVSWDTSLLYDNNKFSDAERTSHIAKLKKQLGEKGYESYMKNVTRKVDKFKLDREIQWGNITDNISMDSDQKKQAFKVWNIENSPFHNLDMVDDPSLRKVGAKYYNPKGLKKYTDSVPLREIKGKPTKWYDKNFDKIEADADLLNYYNLMYTTLKEMKYLIPENKRKLLGSTTLPTLKRSLTDTFSDQGMKMGVKPLWEHLQKMSKTTDLSATNTADVDPLTGEIRKEQSIRFIEDRKSQVNDLVKTKIIKYKQETGVEIIDSVTQNRFREEAKHEISQENSFDLTRLLKAYSIMALEHKHKSVIEPQIRLLTKAFKGKQEIVTNKANEEQREVLEDGSLGDVLTKDGLSNLKSQLDFYLDSRFYNTGARKVEGVSKTKTYTISEKKKLADLKALQENVTTEKEALHLESEINKLGGYVAASAVGDMALKLMTYKGLAYNVGSGFSNLGFGIISNLTEASDGRNYTMAQMKRAYILSLNSIGKNLTLNKWEGVDKNALKIRTLMDKWDLLKTSDEEIYDMSNKSSVVKGLGRFGPMTIQQRTEYLNYAPVMMATMMNQKAKNAAGDSVELWEAYNENGGVKEGYVLPEDFNESSLVLKIKRIIEMNHGDYNNQQQAKATLGGRALSQFRTWMFEGFANRFETERVDDILSYGADKKFVRKGRYRSYSQGQLASAGAVLGTTMLPGIGTIVGGAAGFMVGKFFGKQNEYSGLNDTLFTLKQLARKLAFKKTEFDTRFDEVDAANIRKNMTELYIMLSVAGLGLLIASLAGGDDDDDGLGKGANFLLNQMTRLETDIAFYSNPLEFEKLTKTAVPMAQLINDVAKWIQDVFHLFDGDDENDVFQSGIFKGRSKLGVHTAEIIPGASQVVKTLRSTSQVY